MPVDEDEERRALRRREQLRKALDRKGDVDWRAGQGSLVESAVASRAADAARRAESDNTLELLRQRAGAGGDGPADAAAAAADAAVSADEAAFADAAPPPPPLPLLAGWAEVPDPGSKDVYYWNAASGETTWERPSAAPPPPMPEAAPLPVGWKEEIHAGSGQKFWVNEKGEKRWTAPDSASDGSDISAAVQSHAKRARQAGVLGKRDAQEVLSKTGQQKFVKREAQPARAMRGLKPEERAFHEAQERAARQRQAGGGAGGGGGVPAAGFGATPASQRGPTGYVAGMGRGVRISRQSGENADHSSGKGLF